MVKSLIVGCSVVACMAVSGFSDLANETKIYYLDPGRGTAEGDGTADAPFWSFTNAIAAAENAAETNILVYVDNSKNDHRFDLDETIAVDVPGKNVTFRPWMTKTSGSFNVILDGQGEYGCVMVSKEIKNTVTFRNFTLRNGNSSGYGAGAYSVTLVDSVVTNCTAKQSGGGVAYCILENCQVRDCSGKYGGGAYESTLTNCWISGSAATSSGGGASRSRLYNCRVTECSADANGGGAAGSDLYNCLVLKNRAPNGNGGGAYHSWLYNCTFDGNTAKFGGGFVTSTETTNTFEAVEAINSIILDNGEDKWTPNEDREGDMFRRVFTSGDPRFVDAEHGDYRLRAESPCIDYGYSGYDGLPAVDLAGNPRLRGAEVDLGCYEFPRHAAFQSGTLDVSTNAQVVGTVLYAQGPWRLAVNDEAKGWLSADVTGGSVSNALRFTFAANATGADRSAVVSVFTNGSDVAVQRIAVNQVGSATDCTGTRRGVFIGCARYEPRAKGGEGWSSDTPGSDGDARFCCRMWCNPAQTNDEKVCRLLINESATSNNVISAAERVIDALQPNDEFMLSFSGHGNTDLPAWDNYFTLYPTNEYLAFAEISNMLIRAAAKCAKVLCYIDACNAAGVYKYADQLTCDAEITDRRDMPRWTLASIEPSKSEPYRNEPKIAFIVASDYDQQALSADDDEENGVFTDAFKSGYDTGAADADGDGFLDLHELYRYAYYTASDESQTVPAKLVQGRCYNKPLLLKTIVGTTTNTCKPDIANPLNPYYVDFVNWLLDGSLVEIENPVSTKGIYEAVTNAANRVPLVGGGAMTLADAFVAGYAPAKKGFTNEPFRVLIAVTNGMPHLSWSPDRSKDAVPLRTYAIRANTSLTDTTNWVSFPADATPEQLKPYSFFQIDVKLRQ